MSSRLRFCPRCKNVLEKRQNETYRRLEFVCFTCGHKDVANPNNLDDMVVFRRDVRYQAKNKFEVKSDVIKDPTLQRTMDYNCESCGGTEAVYWQVPEQYLDENDALARVFVCTQCTKYKVEGQAGGDDSSIHI